MSSHNYSHSRDNFQPPPPIRTSTSDSQKSLTSPPQSPFSEASPTTGVYNNRRHTLSPTEGSFFGAIYANVRRSRSRSRSRGATSRNRSKSPLMLPPEQFPSHSNTQPLSPTYSTRRPQQSRHSSSASQPNVSVKPTRPAPNPTRTASDPWRGRHANDWLFGGFSVTETAKGVLHRTRKS